MTHYLTKKGLEELKKELQQITGVDLPAILEEINQQLSQGDISENSALDAARESHDQIQARQSQIEDVLNDYQLIDESIKASSNGTIVLGSTVKIKYTEHNDEFILRIVGGSEANAIDNRISNESPLAQAILGKKKGDTVTFKTKSKQHEVKILDIQL